MDERRNDDSPMSEIISFPGFDCPLEALRLLWRLEERGLGLRVQDDKLIVAGATGTSPALSQDDTAAIRQWKPHLVALVQWCEARREAESCASSPTVVDKT